MIDINANKQKKVFITDLQKIILHLLCLGLWLWTGAGKIINKIKGKRVFFDLSNIFSYHTSHVCYTLTELVESLDRLIETLSNNTEYFFIRGKKPTKQSMPNEKK